MASENILAFLEELHSLFLEHEASIKADYGYYGDWTLVIHACGDVVELLDGCDVHAIEPEDIELTIRKLKERSGLMEFTDFYKSLPWYGKVGDWLSLVALLAVGLAWQLFKLSIYWKIWNQ